jgi:hypothetical protein
VDLGLAQAEVREALGDDGHGTLAGGNNDQRAAPPDRRTPRARPLLPDSAAPCCAST